MVMLPKKHLIKHTNTLIILFPAISNGFPIVLQNTLRGFGWAPTLKKMKLKNVP